MLFVLNFSPLNCKASLSVKFKIDTTAYFDTWFHTIASWDYGIYQIFLDGKDTNKSIDGYSGKNYKPAAISIGQLLIDKGDHVLKFVCTGKNKESKIIFLDWI